jgi:hypothetical protein
MEDKSGPAFPCHNDSALEYNWISSGMTLRDYFAAKAMQSIIQARTTVNGEFETSFATVVDCGLGHPIYEGVTWADDVAGDAYFMADAMLKARNE